MTVAQAWLLVGIPALVLALAMLVWGAKTGIVIAYAALAGGFATLITIDRVSGLVFGALLVMLYAVGPVGGSPRESDDRQPPLVEPSPDLDREQSAKV
ncbi:MAG TPA: hypothetical protein VML96_01235 [Egibacteraceae bacterium]|nr:hypothetical protein [Egibacteraceae bacterium]